MTRENAIHKMEFCRNAYQKLIDEKCDSGTLVGTGVKGEWKSDTPLIKAYADMVDAHNMAIKALEQEPCEDATLKDIFCMGCEYKEQEPILDKIRVEVADIYCGQYCENPPTADSVREMVLDIIDKYKAESGGKE